MTTPNYPVCEFTLPRGTVVKATRYLPAAQVEAGTFGVVFEEANYHEVGTGPMVRWMPDWTVCNVYEEDVVKVAS